eukprot:g9793.t1
MGVEDDTDRLYRNKVILAPMVRSGTLPFRALALRYGADTVFTEEVIDRRVVNAVRTENRVLGTIDYVEPRGKKGNAIPFRTCPEIERDRVVYQVGTGDATHALRAAQHVERDVAAVDVNMGCPKRFSLQGAMGAALLKRPEIAADIVGTLRKSLSVPVSAKIRLLDTPSDTVEFARRIEKAGACALTVHVRRVEDKSTSKARWEELRAVVDAVNIPVIANGDVYTRADMAEIKALSGCSSVMLARPALLNCSIFKPDGAVLPLKEVIQQYLRECIRYDSIYQNAKYTVMEMLTKRRHPDHLKGSISLDLPAGAPGLREVTPAKSLEQLANLWDVGADYNAELVRRRERAEHLGASSALPSAERSCIHKFDDAYFFEPEAMARASERYAANGNGNVHMKGTNGSAAPEGPGGDMEDAGGIANIKKMAAAVPGLPLDGADVGTSGGILGTGTGEGSAVTCREGAAATLDGESSSPREAKQGDGGSGRLREAEMVGAIAARPAEASTVDGGRNGGDGVGMRIGIDGVEDQHNRDCGIVCHGKGVDELHVGGADSSPGDVGAADTSPPAAWTSSKRPRKEEANAGAVM